MKWFRVRTPVLHWRWLFVIALGEALWRLCKWLARHPILPTGAVVIGVLWWAASANLTVLVLVAAGISSLAVGGWAEQHGTDSWAALMAAFTARRRLHWYRARWDAAMAGCKLVQAEMVPELLDVRLGGQLGDRDLDVLTVAMAPGQLVSDWRQVAPRLASAWGRGRVRAHELPGRTDLVVLYVRHGRVRSLPAPVVPDTDDGGEQLQSLHELPPVERTRPGAFPRTPRRTP